MTESAVLLASGGLDSTTLAYWLRERSITYAPLFLNYGQHCASTEYETLRRVMPPEIAIDTMDISTVYAHSSSRLIKEANLWEEDVKYEELYLPYRNLMLLTVAAAHAQSIGCHTVFAGFINSNHAKEIDCSADFFERLSTLLGTVGSVQIQMPFRFMSKYDVAKEALRLGAPIAQTFSCQVSSTVPCGACPNCVDRLDALRKISAEMNGE